LSRCRKSKFHGERLPQYGRDVTARSVTLTTDSLKPRADRARRRGLLASNVCKTENDVIDSWMNTLHIHPAVNYVIYSYVIALSMTSLAQVLSVMESDSDTNILAILLLEVQ